MDLKNMTLGIEFGSTRIKAVLIDERHVPAASGSSVCIKRRGNKVIGGSRLEGGGDGGIQF